MKQNEMTEALNKWIIGVDPEGRERTFESIQTNNRKLLKIKIDNKTSLEFKITVNASDDVIIENDDTPENSGFIHLKTFRQMIEEL